MGQMCSGAGRSSPRMITLPPGRPLCPMQEGAIPDVSFFMPTPSAHHDLPDLNKRDDDNCTPLHVAILHGGFVTGEVPC